MQNKSTSTPWFTIAFSLVGALSLFERMGSNAFLNFYQDDAFYYFQIARNIATAHRSTFDGIHLTNGYHPLWMLLLVALNLISTGKLFFVLLKCVSLASFIITFLTARTLFRYFSNNLLFTEIAASFVALQCLLLLHSSMEVTLTLPLVLLLCRYRLRPQFRWTPTTACAYGLLAALIVLSRLDAIILIALLFFFEFIIEKPISSDGWLSRIYAVLATTIPLAIYALSNKYWFQVWTPISGQAKQLRLHHSLYLSTLQHQFQPIFFLYRLLIIVPTFFIILLCIAGALKSEKLKLSRGNLAVSLSLILLPVLQILAFLLTSDWPIWPWYLYSFPLAMTGGLLIFFNQRPPSQAVTQKRFSLLLQTAMILIALLFGTRITVGQSSWYVFGKEIEAFSQTHHGIYAMGDSAGTPGYLIHEPLIQLEGLVMDASFLDNIRRQRNLNQVLASYNVRYYVTIDAKLINGCYSTTEPSQAGPDSPHMRGSFCQKPIASYPHGSATVNIFDLAPAH